MTIVPPVISVVQSQPSKETAYHCAQSNCTEYSTCPCLDCHVTISIDGGSPGHDLTHESLLSGGAGMSRPCSHQCLHHRFGQHYSGTSGPNDPPAQHVGGRALARITEDRSVPLPVSRLFPHTHLAAQLSVTAGAVTDGPTTYHFPKPQGSIHQPMPSCIHISPALWPETRLELLRVRLFQTLLGSLHATSL